MLWDLNEGKHLYSLEAGDIVNALVFSPNRYWLCAATASCVKIFDLESKYVLPVSHLSRVYVTNAGPLSTSSNQHSLKHKQRNQNVYRSLGLQMVRHYLAASPTTTSGCGPSAHESGIATLLEYLLFSLYMQQKKPPCLACFTQVFCETMIWAMLPLPCFVRAPGNPTGPDHQSRSSSLQNRGLPEARRCGLP